MRERERERAWVKLTERKSNTKMNKIKAFIDLLIFFNQAYQLEKMKYLNILHTDTHIYIYKLIDYLQYWGISPKKKKIIDFAHTPIYFRVVCVD